MSMKSVVPDDDAWTALKHVGLDKWIKSKLSVSSWCFLNKRITMIHGVVTFKIAPICHFDPLTKSHWASWLFPAGVKYGPLTTTTHYTAALDGLWKVCSPQHLAPAVVRSFPPVMTIRYVFMEQPPIVVLIFGIKHPLTASPIFSGLPLAFCSTPVTTNPSQVQWSPNLQVGICKGFLQAVIP